MSVAVALPCCVFCVLSSVRGGLPYTDGDRRPVVALDGQMRWRLSGLPLDEAGSALDEAGSALDGAGFVLNE